VIIVQIGANKGNDHVTEFVKKHKDEIEFCLIVEPIPTHIKDLEECYKDISNVYIEASAITPIKEASGKYMTMFFVESDYPFYEIASLDPMHLINHGYEPTQIMQIQVPCITLQDLLLRFDLNRIDYLFIDAEALDAAIVLSIDLDILKIKSIEYEEKHILLYKDAVRRFLMGKNYVEVPDMAKENESVRFEKN